MRNLRGKKKKLIARAVSIFVLAAVALFAQGCGGKSASKLEVIFYPTSPLSPKIQYLNRYKTSRDVGKKIGGFQKFITGQREEFETLSKPHAAGYYKGKLYVCDSRPGEVVIMDLVQKTMSVLGEKDSFAFGKPLSIAISGNGIKYVADNIKKRIHMFDATDRYAGSFGEEGQFSPTSVAIYGEQLYVADVEDKEVEVLNRITGDVITSTRGSEDAATGYFRMPVNLTVDHEGNLYVTDLLAANVHVFDSSLNFIKNIGEPGDRLGQFGRPRGIAVDSAGFIYVADAAFENVQVFSPDGELALYFGGPSLEPGGMYLPSGITISYDDLEIFSNFVDEKFKMKYAIIVSNQYGPNGVSIYGFGEGKKGFFDSAVNPTSGIRDKAESHGSEGEYR